MLPIKSKEFGFFLIFPFKLRNMKIYSMFILLCQPETLFSYCSQLDEQCGTFSSFYHLLQRLIVVELLSLNEQGAIEEQMKDPSWQTELYLGEFNNLQIIGLLSEENVLPLLPRLKDWKSNDHFVERSCHKKTSEVLQVIGLMHLISFIFF